MRTRHVFCVCCALVSVLAAQLHAEPVSEYPSKPIRLIVGFSPGGISDVLARALGARLAESLGQQMVVDNRPGAGTTIASQIIARAASDGYTLFMQDTTTHAINASLYRKLPYDSVKDFTAIGLVAATPLVLLVHPSVPAKSVKDLIALARAQPGRLSYASAGNGTILHLAAEMLKSYAHVDLVHVPYKGGSDAVRALLGGEVGVAITALPTALSQVQAGKLRALAVTTARRAAVAPDVPTAVEAGLAGFVVVLESGMLGPAGMEKKLVERLNGELAKAVGSSDMKAIFARIGAEPVTDTPEHFARRLLTEIAIFGKAIKDANARLE